MEQAEMEKEIGWPRKPSRRRSKARMALKANPDLVACPERHEHKGALFHRTRASTGPRNGALALRAAGPIRFRRGRRVGRSGRRR